MARPAPDEATTLHVVRFDPSPDDPGAFRLTVVAGPDTGATLLVDAGVNRALVGTSTSCDLRLTDRQVSRRHLAVQVEGDRLRIDDQDSTNGTRVDGVSILAARLEAGQSIRIGESTLEVARLDESEPARRPPARVAFGRMIGASTEVRRLYPLCERLAAAKIPVLIEGETGTGKEALAEALHEMGPRASGPFVVFDCTAVPPSLVETELFGHERGAFTGAAGARQGVFEQAHGGTLLIDEIGDLDPPLQPKLLRALERGEIRRVGGGRAIRVDVRVLAATRRDLDQEVQAGRFRDDLFHRLVVSRVELPPLSRRRGDVALLAKHFWKQLGGDPGMLDPELLARWERASWPGNVRELRNAVARHLALGALAEDHAAGSVPPDADVIQAVIESGHPLARARQEVVAEFERRYVAHLLEAHGGNVTQAAAAAGVARRYFRLLKSRQGGGDDQE